MNTTLNSITGKDEADSLGATMNPNEMIGMSA